MNQFDFISAFQITYYTICIKTPKKKVNQFSKANCKTPDSKSDEM